MYIICQNCNTNFIVDPKQIGNEGRKVKCSQCSYIWYFKPKVSELKTEEPKLNSDKSSNLSEQDLHSDDLRSKAIRSDNLITDYKELLHTGVNLPVRVNNKRNSYFSKKLLLNLLTACLMISTMGSYYFLFKYDRYFQQNSALNKISLQNFNFVLDNENEKFIIKYQLHNNSSKKALYLPIINTQLFDKNNKLINSHIDKTKLKLLTDGSIKINTEFYKLNKEVSHINIILGNRFYFFIKKLLTNL